MSQEITGFLGLFLPPVIDIINTKITDSRVRFLASLLVCTILGIIIHSNEIVAGVASVEKTIHTITAVFTTAQATYHIYWDKSDARTEMKANINKII